MYSTTADGDEAADGLRSALRRDIDRTFELQTGSKPARFLRCFRSPGVHAMVAYRLGRWLKNSPKAARVLGLPLYLILERRSRTKWGIEISKSAAIGPGFYIGHFGGITISNLAMIGEGCNISQQVVIGVSGQGGKFGAPQIGDNVYIGPGAKLFGPISIGDNVKIGANAVIHKDVPTNAIVVLNPGFDILSYKGNSPVSSSAATPEELC